MEMTDVREDLAALRREVASLREEVAKVQGENAAPHGAVVLLEQALVEERTTRQTVVEDRYGLACGVVLLGLACFYWVRRRAAPSGRSQRARKMANDVTVQTEPQPSAVSDVIVQTEPQPSATCDVTVQTEPQPSVASLFNTLQESLGLVTMTTFDAPSALGEDQLTALLQSLPRLEELTVRVPSFGTGRWLRLLPTSLRTLYVAGPEVTEPRWPGQYGSGLSVSLQGVAADTISHLATELGSRITLLVTDAQVTTIPSQLRGAIIRVGPNTIILPAGVGDSELTELQISRETVERLSVTATDLPRLSWQLPKCLRCLNVRGPEVTEPRCRRV
ncbi:uncharacterized protein LOC122379497 [Amphibalanus amphitrite]|uniref:uncharacterized protein LOC122379497 n=1 Tax=Amphibalanus amphitrite TaxID=1232801 RepID=UPI001C91FDAE|nr:uncharacterized protein LOC122379497 [Amphibalanus amphitrite]